MAASNKDTNTGTTTFFKLKEDKVEGSDTKGQFRFYQQEKSGDGWKDGKSFNSMEGHLTAVQCKSYDYQGKPKDVFEFTLTDTAGIKSVISLGLDTNAAKQIINTFAGEAELGNLTLNCGNPKESKGKWYPTLYVNNNGQKTTWKYSKENGNLAEVPVIITKNDEDGNNIRTGVKANLDFWKGVIEKIKGKLSDAPPVTAEPAEPKSEGEKFLDDSGETDDLPFMLLLPMLLPIASMILA